jgi:hypothetical protein
MIPLRRIILIGDGPSAPPAGLTISYEAITVNGQQVIRLYGSKPAGSTVSVYKR